MFAASKTASVSGGYQISRSLRFNSADSTNLNRTPSVAANQQIWTFSIWLKRSLIGANYEGIFSSGNGTDQIRFENNDVFRFGLNGSTAADFLTTQVFRDVSAWYHIVVAVDTTQATASNRVKIYVNGSQVTSFSTANYPSQNYNTFFNNTADHRIGVASTSSYYFNGYMTEFNWIGGLQLTPSSFGETNAQTGVWQPKAYSGSYGTNGFYLNFSDNSNTTAATLGKDYSGNGNNWTPNNFSVTAGSGNDSLVDSPTAYGTDTGVGGTVRGNYATLNPLSIGGTLANGNLDYTGPTGYGIAPSTIGMTSGKWYFEMTVTSNGVGCGLSTNSASLTQYLGQNASGWAYFDDGLKYTNNSGSSYGATFTTNDVIGVAFDADAGTLTFYKNGTSQGTAFSSLTSGPYFFTVSDGSSPAQRTCTANFGQRPFAYTAPSGYKALCTQNLPTPTIGATTATQAGKYFNPVLYTANGGTLNVTGVGFQPDFVWLKDRVSATWAHNLFDSVRGVNLPLSSNLTSSESTRAGTLTSFNSDGFSLGSDPSYAGTNISPDTYVAWNWKANGSGSTNTAGSITSTVSANTTSGFSVVTYTGTGVSASVGHGLGALPQMIIVKRRNSTADWAVYHRTLGANTYLFLNSTAASASVSNYWQYTTTPGNPTTDWFGVIGGYEVNVNTATYVAYCFAEVAGYSKFGQYTGNASTDGPFVYCGFRPAYIMVKGTASSGYNWLVFDSARDPYNLSVYKLFANLSDAESGNNTLATVDLVSNGFKIRSSNNQINDNYLSGQFIFMAFASNPFKYSLAR